ncbi:hypothetical protein [Hellea balneolensis]|uniref:hypothetical protein n=1 Tax=Hellea balneolensis TaxID=287478 RepID=UPI00042079F9|nr:hypothetical protein [Hellea balneolensis]
MLKLIVAAAPYFLKAPGHKSDKQMARSFTALVLFVLSGISLILATFVFVTTQYGMTEGFLSVSFILFLLASVIYLKAGKPERTAPEPRSTIASNDPIAALLPDSIIDDPATSRILNQVSANPIATTLAAAAIGTIITREIMKD